MKGVAWLSIVGLLAFLCIVLCLLRFGIEEIQAGAISLICRRFRFSRFTWLVFSAYFEEA